MREGWTTLGRATAMGFEPVQLSLLSNVVGEGWQIRMFTGVNLHHFVSTIKMVIGTGRGRIFFFFFKPRQMEFVWWLEMGILFCVGSHNSTGMNWSLHFNRLAFSEAPGLPERAARF